MRAAAVQLNATADSGATSRPPIASRARRPPTARQLVVLPEKWSVLGTPERPARRRRAARRPGASPGRATIAARAGHRPRRRLDRRARRGRESKLRNTSRARRPRRRGPGRSTARSTCSTSRSAARLPRVRAPRSPATRSCVSETADGVELGLTICYDLRFPELYRILAVARRARPDGARRLHARHHARPLGGPAARPRDRGPGFVIAANQIGAAPGRPPLRRALDDRRPLGRRPRAGARQPRPSSPPTSTSTARTEIRAQLPSLANRRPRPTRGRRRCHA